MVQGENVELTNREFELLHTLMRNKNIVLTREKLLNEVCGYDYVARRISLMCMCGICGRRLTIILELS